MEVYIPVEVYIGLSLVTCKHNWLIKTALLWTVEIANATQVCGLYHLSLFPNAFAWAKMLLTHLQCKGKSFFPGNCLLLVHVPKDLLCAISSSAICLQCVLLSPPSLAVSLLWDPQCDHTQYYPLCFIFLTASHRKFSHEGGFVNRPSSLCLASDLFPFFSSCHSSLLLNLSCLLNLICIFPLLLY